MTSPRAKPAALRLWHDADYVDALLRADRAHYRLGTHSNPIYPEMYRRPATGAGGALLAGELLRDGGVIYHPAGFRPDAVVLQCGSDAVEEDPLSRSALSNNALWVVVAALHLLLPCYLALSDIDGSDDPGSVANGGRGGPAIDTLDRAQSVKEPARGVVHLPARRAARGPGARADRGRVAGLGVTPFRLV